MAETPRVLTRSGEHIDPKRKLRERLASDAPIPSCMNHYSVMEKLERFETDVDCLASVVHCLATIRCELEAKKPWPPLEVLGGVMCAQQFHSLFGHCRVPNVRTGADNLHTYPHSRHVALLVRGSMFELRAVTDDGAPVAEGVLRKYIAQAAAMAEEHTKSGLGEGADLSSFTAMERRAWGRLRADLVTDPRNEAAIRCAESSLFVAALDAGVEGVGWDVGAYFGDGNTRWFDHCLNVAVRDRSPVLIIEESDVDSFGLSWLSNTLLARLKSDACPAPDASPAPSPEPEREASAEAPEDTPDAAAEDNTATETPAEPPQRTPQGPTHLEHCPAAPALGGVPVAACVEKYFQPRRRGAETVVHPSFAVLLFDLPVEGATGDALVDIAGALAYYRLKKRIPEGLGRVGLHRFEGGRNINLLPIPTQEARAFIRAVCGDSEDRVFQNHELGRVLLKAMEVGAAARGEAEEGYIMCEDAVDGGHKPLYTCESVWMPEANERGGKYRIYGSQPLHFTYSLGVFKPGNTYSFSWMAPAFDEFPELFKGALDECVHLLTVFSQQNPLECRTMRKPHSKSPMSCQRISKRRDTTIDA